MGPSAMIKNLKLDSNIRANKYLERAFCDTDLKAADAVSSLYKNDVRLSSIQRAFSVGSFGIEDKRKLVPTRWSITAVDSMLSKEYMEVIKQYPTINEFRVYESNYLDNLFQIILLLVSRNHLESFRQEHPNVWRLGKLQRTNHLCKNWWMLLRCQISG